MFASPLAPLLTTTYHFLLSTFSMASISLPAVRTLADCVDFQRTVLPYLPQLRDLPQQVLKTWNNVHGLKVLYLSTNPLVSATAFAGVLAAIVFVVAEINKNYSQVDRLWSIIPTVYNVHYAIYAHAVGLPTARLDFLAAISLLWSVRSIPHPLPSQPVLRFYSRDPQCRLTYNYWRKGGYTIGSEDYRWEVLKDYIGPSLFVLFDIFFIAAAQSFLLLSVTFPTYVLVLSTHVQARLLPVDYGFGALLLTAIAGSFVADQQQWNYQNAKALYKKTAKVTPGYHPVDLDRGFLTTGLWQYSRHPNFAFEQSVWVGLFVWSCRLVGTFGNWAGVGAGMYLILFQASTWFTELLSARKYPEYKEYQQRVGKFVPPGRESGKPGDFSDKREVKKIQ
jgi:steroid 5-alpha reductase family enzyme